MLYTRLAFRWTERGPISNNRCGNKFTFGKTKTELGIPPSESRGVCNSLIGAPGNSRSKIPDGLPDGVNNVGNWAARGVFRFQPSAADMDWVLNLHGCKVDQLSTLGQALGTNDG